MKLQRCEVGDDYEMPGDYGDHGTSCKSTDVERLEAENSALHAECDRLTAMLQWEQNRRDHIGTHGDECRKWGPAHYECALAEIERLTAMLKPQKPLTAEEVTEPGWYWHKLDCEDYWEAVNVILVNDKFNYSDGCFFRDMDGQFFGPLKAPEV